VTADDLQARIRKHNAVQILVGVIALAGSPLLWYVSFYVLRVLFAMATYWFLQDRTAEVTYWIAMAGLGILAIEGVWRVFQAFSLTELARRPSIPLILPVGPAYFGNLQGYSFILTHILFCAPQTTLAGIQVLRSLLRPGPFTIESAVRIYADLAKRRAWVDLDEYPGGAGAAALLGQLGLIWTEAKEGPLRLRIPPREGA
jgi:hypothetical protein